MEFGDTLRSRNGLSQLSHCSVGGACKVLGCLQVRVWRSGAARSMTHASAATEVHSGQHDQAPEHLDRGCMQDRVVPWSDQTC